MNLKKLDHVLESIRPLALMDNQKHLLIIHFLVINGRKAFLGSLSIMLLKCQEFSNQFFTCLVTTEKTFVNVIQTNWNGRKLNILFLVLKVMVQSSLSVLVTSILMVKKKKLSKHITD